MDESTDTIYFNLFLNNADLTDSSPVACAISQQINQVVPDISAYNLYINSITITSDELPYCNLYNSIGWNNSNFATNKTNFSITLTDSAYNFDLNGNTNLLVSGVNEDPGNPGFYNTVVIFLQYLTENSTLVDPNTAGTGANSQFYPRGYFNVHSVSQMLSFLNTALTTGFSLHSGGLSAPYFYFNPSTNLYSLSMVDAVKTSNINFYFNTFLTKVLTDSFRTKFLKNSDVSAVGYDGMDYQLIKANTPNNLVSGVWTYTSEYPNIRNLYDIHSMVITCGGSFTNIKKQYFQNLVSISSINMQSLPILKSLDFVYQNDASGNNSIIQFEAVALDRPINMETNTSLNDLVFNFSVMDIYGTLTPLQLSSNGLCNLKFCLKKRNSTAITRR